MSRSTGTAENPHIVDLLSSEVLSPEYVVETAEKRLEISSSPTPQRVKRPKFVNLISSDGPGGSTAAPPPRTKIFVEKGNVPIVDAQTSISAPKGRPSVKLAKVSWNRKDSVKELLCAIHGNLPTLAPALEEIGVRNSQQPAQILAGVPGYISLRRETKTVWNHAMQTYVQGELHVEREKTLIAVLDAACCPELKGDPLKFFEQIETFIGNSSIIYLIEGIDKIFQTQLRNYNKALQQRTRAAIKDGNDGAGIPLPPYPSKEEHMRLKINIQRTNRRIVYTKDRKNTVRWTLDLLKDISIKRYLSDEVLKLNAKSVKSKTEIKDITLESLSQIPGVSKRQATSITATYGCLGRVFQEYKDGVEIQRLIHSADPEECL